MREKEKAICIPKRNFKSIAFILLFINAVIAFHIEKSKWAIEFRSILFLSGIRVFVDDMQVTIQIPFILTAYYLLGCVTVSRFHYYFHANQKTNVFFLSVCETVFSMFYLFKCFRPCQNWNIIFI